MSVNAREEEYEHVELFGRPALFTNSRIDRGTVPEGFHCYDLRGSDRDPGKPVTVENRVIVNHAGTVLTAEPVTIFKEGFRRLRGGLNFLGECLTLPEFCKKQNLRLPPDDRKFILRPASPDEAGLFFALPKERDAELGAVGCVRIDFGRDGDEFWHTWWPRGDESLNSAEFKAELQELVDELRTSGPLKNLSAMCNYCGEHGGQIEGGRWQNYGYVAETERYRYCLRCELGYVLKEQGQGMPCFCERFRSAMELENCTRLDCALDISQNLRCYDFIPKQERWEQYGQQLARQRREREGVFNPDSPANRYSDVAAYCKAGIERRGLSPYGWGYIARNDRKFLYGFSRPPQPEQSPHLNL